MLGENRVRQKNVITIFFGIPTMSCQKHQINYYFFTKTYADGHQNAI